MLSQLLFSSQCTLLVSILTGLNSNEQEKTLFLYAVKLLNPNQTIWRQAIQ